MLYIIKVLTLTFIELLVVDKKCLIISAVAAVIAELTAIEQ